MTITLTREEAQQVLDALDFHSAGDEVDMKLIGMIRARLSAPESTAHFQFRGKMHVVCKCDKCVAQPEPEPVAWRFDQAKYRENDLRGRRWAFNVFSQTKPYMDEMVRNVTPLYKDPTPCQTCEALARTVMMDQASHDTRLQRERVKFPTMLRKMWSGSEVQAWLDETVNKENKR